jgi:uncharacterized protein YbbC (DUF1343 family)
MLINGATILAANPIKGNCAMVTNNAAITQTGALSRVALLKAGIKITKLFSPEHGITKTGADGEAQQNAIDLATDLPIISLYGQKLAPTAQDLAGIDFVLFDIPDIGARFYTYLWTLTYVMQACATYNKPLIVLDSPNPTGINLHEAEGPFLHEACSSFIGRFNIPIRHCCTLGELANYFAATKIKNLNLQIIKVKNYHRHTHTLAHTSPPAAGWVAPSPAITSLHTAMLYPGTCLLEGVNVHEGRGTNHPFSICGAPYIHATELLNHWQQKQMPGISTKAISYTPAESIYTGQLCHGLQFTITNQSLLKPVAMGIQLLQTIQQLYPTQFGQRLYPTAANPTGSGHLSKLLGVPNAFENLQAGFNTAIANEWKEMVGDWVLY